MSTSSHTKKTSWAGHVLAHGPSWLAAIALFALMAMTFSDVVLRSVFDNPIEAATELTRLFMAIIVFSSLPIVTWKGSHIVVDLMDPFYSRFLARIRDTLIDLICGVVLLWPALRVWQLAERAQSYGDVTEYLNMPQFYIAYFISVSAFLSAFVLLARAILRIFAPSRIPLTQSQM